MASARNMVIAGDYAGCRVFCMTGKLAYISGTMKKMDDIFLTPETVTRYELMTEDIIRSGNSLLLTGALDPGNLKKLRLHASPAMQSKGIYTVALKFEDDKRSLLEIDEKTYRAIVRRMQTAE
ncbi:MAG: hypothetical protein IKI77_02490 [Oscillospiraceae bacterium]|nr:hypothetical protein [Oscillospiraceae bacterium]